MSAESSWPRVAVVGAGAVGGYFGGMLAPAGAPVVMIGRPAFVDAVKKNGLLLDTLQFKEGVRVEAATELKAVRGADIVLFCVKTTDTRPQPAHLRRFFPRAIVVSLQNGVDNAEQIRAASGIEALGTVVYVAASVPEPGRIKHSGAETSSSALAAIERAVRKRVRARWRALPHLRQYRRRTLDEVNLELRAQRRFSAGTREVSRYADESARKVVETAVYEVLAVAKAARIHPPGLEDPKAALAGAFKIATQMSEAHSSTAQDMCAANGPKSIPSTATSLAAAPNSASPPRSTTPSSRW